MINDENKTNPRRADAKLTIHRCGEGHAFFHPHGQCPVCGSATQTEQSGATATIIAHTTVRVTPNGQQFRLGLAENDSGAKTLCIIDDGVDVDDGDVIVYFEDGLYHVRSRHQENGR